MNQEIEQFELHLSKDLETEGFDLQAGQTWIYPTNYSIRDYQHNIVQQALLKNTLVSLPTGLGKTFIAAVVMYNFFRWYPLGKVIFMAPTRPLVKQQIEACYNIMAIPKDVTVELTGTKLWTSREDIWKDKRVFFITPQILQNDLEKLVQLRDKIKCLVFDEAHRARGNHAYCEVIRRLVPHNQHFRVLALSATPGNTIGDVLEVVNNLLISHLEFRTEESEDVKPYVFERNLTTVVVPLGDKLQQVRDDYLQVLEFYTRSLVKYKVIQGNCGNLTKGKIFMTLKEFQQRNNNSSANYAEIMKSLNICVTLYHGFELLIRHGLRSFLSFFDEHMSKPLLRGSYNLIEILNDIRDYLGPTPVVEQLPDGSFSEISNNTKFGHPKFYKLRDILVSHFSLENDSSRVIVFFEYRNSVMEAHALLNQSRPVLKPRIFLGQGKGITQRQQLNVIKLFKEGKCNVLLSTCIGEEGLDVGEVDLIVCFDISNKSPIRMVQRMGRTGRKKEGHVTVLVTEGKEQQILKDCLIHKNNIAFHVLSSKELARGLRIKSPRLVPPQIEPKCEKIYITIQKPVLSKKSSIKDMFRKISSSSSEPHFSPDLEIVEIIERIPDTESLWNKENPLDENLLIPDIFSKRVEKQRTLQITHLVKHSPNTELLVSLLQQVDSKRFNLPTTEIGYPSQLTRALKQTDIRNMFSNKPQSCREFLPWSQTQKSSTTEPDQIQDNPTKELLSEISNYLSVQISDVKAKCRHCPDNFDCTTSNISLDTKEITWTQQDDTVYNTVTLEDLNAFFEMQILKLDKNFDNSDLDHNGSAQHDRVSTSEIKEVITIDDFDSDWGNDILPRTSQADKSCAYQPPKTLDILLNKYSTSIIDVDDFSEEQLQNKVLKNQIHKDSDWDRTLLDFFLLKSLEDLYPSLNNIEETGIDSPDIIETSSIRTSDDEETNNQEKQYNLSPVLCRYDRVRNIKNVQRKLFTKLQENSDHYKPVVECDKSMKSVKPNLKKLMLRNPSESYKTIDSPSKFSTQDAKSSSTPFCSRIQKINTNGNCNGPSLQTEVVNDERQNEMNKLGKVYDKDIDIDDLCDLSIFGLKSATEKVENNANKKEIIQTTESTLHIDDICDLTAFGITSQVNKMPRTKETGKNEGKINNISSKGDASGANDSLCCGTSNITNFRRNNGLLPSQSQISITQMIDYINTDEKSTSQKENLDVSKAHSVLNDNNNKSVLPLTCNNKLSPKSSIGWDSRKYLHDSSFAEASFNWKKPVAIKKQLKESNRRASKVAVRKKPVNPFIHDEAELSDDENIIVSEDEDDEEQNLYDQSFVDDGTQNMDTQMHVRYLQSTRSPRNQGKFKIPQKPKLIVNSVYSQEVHREDDTYLDDSFVVHDDVEDVQHEMSELEIMERQLRLRKKKRSKSDDIDKPSKRKRIRRLSSDESD